ncbi:putative reverse transcriptase domain-containing protein [Tanacetum coccineum]
MVSTMTTHNAGRRTAATLGGGISEQDGRKGKRTGGQAGSGRGGQGSGRGSQGSSRGGQGSNRGSQGGCQGGQESDQGSQGSSRRNGANKAQVGNHVNNQGNNRNQYENVINDNVQGNARIINVNNGRGVCSYKEFWACHPKDYDGKGRAIVYTRWIEKMQSVQDMSGCGENQKTRGQEAAVGMTWEDFKVLMRKELCPNNEIQKLEAEFWCNAMVGAGHAAYTDRFHKLARNGALRKNTEKRGNNGEPSRNGNAMDNNKRSRTGMAFSIITNPVRKEYTGTAPKCPNYNYHHQPEVPCHLCTNCNYFGHIAKDCRVWPRAVNPLNARNLIAARRACFECGGTDHYKATCPSRGNNDNPACGKAFVMGTKEARQDPDIMTSTFTLNNHYATTLFDSGADYSFVSTTFIPLLDIEPSGLGFSYEIKIASGQLIEINKLSRHKAEIVCQEKVVRIPLLNGEMLRVLGERPEEKVFLDDLSGLPPIREIVFHIDLIPRDIPVAKSPYHLAPFRIEELSSQLKELQDKSFIQPSSSP